MNITSTYRTATSKTAWELMRAFEAAGVCAGYPSLSTNSAGCYTVLVDFGDTAKADTVYDNFHGGLPC